jgi:hypothetical protein
LSREADQRDEGIRGMPQARHIGADLLRLEGEVRRHERLGRQAVEAARGGECEAEDAAGGGDAGQRGAEGHHVKKVVTPAARRAAVTAAREAHGISERRACSIIGADRTAMRYRHRRVDDAAIRTRLKELAAERWRFGWRRLKLLLEREGIRMNYKKLRVGSMSRSGCRCVAVAAASAPWARGRRGHCRRARTSAGHWTLSRTR